MTQKRQKFIAHTTRGLDDNGLVEAVVSTEAVDRDGDIIRASGWDLDNFIEHPVLIASHDYSSLLNQIGEWTDIGVQGKRLVGKVQYMVGEGNPEVDWGFKLAKRGQAAYSVGFIPDMAKAKELKTDGGGWATYEFRGQELLEVSHVTIPSNYECLQRIKGLELHPVIREVVDGLLSDVPDISGGNADGTFTSAQMSQLRELFAEFAREPELVDEQLAPVVAHLEANTIREHIARWFST